MWNVESGEWRVIKKTASAVFFIAEGQLPIVVSMQRLHILRMCHLNSLQLTRFVELLTTTELFYDTRLIEFAFEFLNRALDVLTFFNRDDNHCIHLLSRVPRAGIEPARFPIGV